MFLTCLTFLLTPAFYAMPLGPACRRVSRPLQGNVEGARP
jgi:hypothetical protein